MANDPSTVTPGDSTYSLRTPDTVPAADVPSMPMERVLPRQTSTGVARGVQQLGSPLIYVDSGNEQIVVAKTDTNAVTTPQVLMGNQVNKGEGFYVTKPGIDVTTAKNDSDFIFNSNENVLKIVAKGTATISSFGVGGANINYAQLTIPHGQSFTPLANIYAEASMVGPSSSLIASNFVSLPIIPPNPSGSVGSTLAVLNTYLFPSVSGNLYSLGMTYIIDSQNIYINVGSTVASTSPADTINPIPITYLLFQETAAN